MHWIIPIQGRLSSTNIRRIPQPWTFRCNQRYTGQTWTSGSDRLTAHTQCHKARKTSDPDLFTWDEAMRSEHRERFLEAAQKEIDELVSKGTWYEDDKANATKKITPCKWVFKLKRSADEGDTVKKYKGRICLRGDLQEDDGRSNYSPVASWSTVRCFLILSVILGWVTTSIDFSNAFVQSNLPDDDSVWM